MNISSTHLRLLAGLLAAPGEESLEALTELAKEHPWLQAAVNQLAELSLAQWQVEHTRLFVSGYPKTRCPPFESVYRHHVMNSYLCEEISKLYRAVGLEPVEGLFPDYLGTLLECAAYLWEQPHYQPYREILWEQHIRSWVPRFADDLQQHSQLNLYQQLGHQLKELF